MYKILKIAVVLLLIIGLALQFKPEPEPQTIVIDSFVTVSADSSLLAGSRQDFVIYLLNPRGEAPAPESYQKLGARLLLSGTGDKGTFVLESDARPLSDGAYVVSFDIPDGSLNKQATLEVIARENDTLIYRGEATIERNVALMVLPPPEVIYAGNWLQLRVAVLCRKSGRGIFKVPVRVKLILPGGQQTVNRVIHSDIDGTAMFTTHLNNNTAAGIYSVEFSHGKEMVSVRLDVKSMSNKRRAREDAIQQKVANPISAIMASDIIAPVPQKYWFATKTSQQGTNESLHDVTIEKNQIYLSYRCPGSSWRQIEVWQNGRIHYTSDLQLESGRISLSFKIPLQSDTPISLKLWHLDANGIQVCEQKFFRRGEQETPISMFFRKTDEMFENKGSEILARRALAAPGIFSSNLGSRIRITNTSQTISQHIEPVIPPASEFVIVRETPARLLKSDVYKKSARRFFLVDNELQLDRYRFSTIRIWHHPRRLLGSMIRALMLERSNIAFLIGEAELRVLRLQHMSVAERQAELEKLEGLLAPMIEFYEYSKDDAKLRAAWHPGILRATNRMREHIFIPEKLAQAIKEASIDSSKIGPFSPVLPGEVTLENLLAALRPGGKVSLVSNERQMPINLSGDVSIFSSKSFSGKDEQFEKLINTRALPVVVELDFTGTKDN